MALFFNDVRKKNIFRKKYAQNKAKATLNNKM